MARTISGSANKTAPGTVLVIGATGGIGGATVPALQAKGWKVRALHRNPAAAAAQRPDLVGVDWVAGDAMARREVVAAARDASLIVHAANPPRYKNWRGLAMPMLENAVAAAEAAGATLVYPGSVYNFGPDAGALVAEHAPQNPTTRKGAVRVEMEMMLARAAERGVRSLVVRAGDFFGAHAPGSWFQLALVKPGKPLRAITYPGDPAIGHSWAYLPDLARTIAALVERRADLKPFEIFHFAGHDMARGSEMIDAIRAAAGAPEAPVKMLPWAMVYAAAPFVASLRELIEMRYLWRTRLRLDNTKLQGLLGEEPHTPLAEAVRATLGGMGCLAGTVTERPALAAG